jgi:monoamine oxidase
VPRAEIDRWLNVRRPKLRVSRREALTLAAAGTTSWLLSSQRADARGRLNARRVLIVGAGFSGLACAHELLSAGCEVQVFEARNRVGGRVLSFKDLVQGKTVEGGGELLGSNHPIVLAYAEKFGLEFLVIPDDAAEHPAPVEIGGRRLTAAEIEATAKEIDRACAQMTDDARAVDPDAPWKTPGAAGLDHRSTADWISKLDISELAKKLLASQFTADNGVAVEQQSYLGNLSQVRGGGLERYWDETEVYRCKGGNQQFATRLAEAVGPERIHLGCPIARISVTDARVTVTDASGKAWEGDDVVLTAPPSTWHKLSIEPKLPDILAPQMGTAVKYLAAVDRPFWTEHGLPPAAFSDGPLSSVWWGTAAQPKDPPGEALVSFTGGPQAKTWAQLPPADRETRHAELLEGFFPGYRAAVGERRFMNWVGDPWTLAGYSFPAPGQVTAQGPLLQRGIGRLHFAGEHTCYQFVGYMEGALHSGAALAKRLVASNSRR